MATKKQKDEAQVDLMDVDAKQAEAAAAQATAEAAAKEARARADEAAAAAAAAKGLVIITSPRAFRLHLKPGVFFNVKVGVQEVPEEVATHWYCLDNGVEVFTPSKKEE